MLNICVITAEYRKHLYFNSDKVYFFAVRLDAITDLNQQIIADLCWSKTSGAARHASLEIIESKENVGKVFN
jgi:hypothetical protein